MAALEWIKLSCDLPDKWQVLSIRRALKLRTVDEVVGKLFRLWSHFENHSKGGRIRGLVPEDLDIVVGKKGFAAAVASVGWLAFDDAGAVIPAYDEYMGAAARSRDAEAEKKRQQRAAAEAAELERQRRDAAGTGGGTSTGQVGDTTGTATGQAGGQNRDRTGTQETETEGEGKKNPPNPPAGGDGANDPAAEKARLKAEAAAKKAALDAAFAEFWLAYPKKLAKADAERAFAKLAPPPDLLRTILDAVGRQRAWHTWTKDGGQFVPNAATWLNARRWEDEPPAAPPPKPPPRTARDRDDEFTARMLLDALPPDPLHQEADP